MTKHQIIALAMVFGVGITFGIQAQENTLPGSEVRISEPVATTAKVFSDQEGNLYWNLSLPVYLSISSSPDGANGHRLKNVKSVKMKEYTNPMYFDGHGIHYIRHLDYENPVPESEEAFVVNVDGRKPVTSASFNDAPRFVTGGKTYYGKGLNVTLSGSDEMSGVERTFYSIDAADYLVYQKAIGFSGEKSYALSFYTMDNVGNVEETANTAFIVDVTPPATTMQVEGDRLNEILSPKASLIIASSDNGAGVKASLVNMDGSADRLYTGPYRLSGMAEGEHTFGYYSKDHVQNQEEVHTYKFYLDRTAPEVSSEIVGDFYQKNGKTFLSDRSQVKIEATDNKAGVDIIYYSLNGKEAKVYTGPFSLEGIQGSHGLVYRAVDKVNNATKYKTDGNIGNGSVFLDKTAPALSHSFSGASFLSRDTMFITSETKVILKGSDYESGLQKIDYQLDQGTTITYQDPLNIAGSGFHKIKMTAFDEVNNARDDEFFFVTDNEGPEIFWHLSINKIGTQQLEGYKEVISVYPKHALLYLAATDAMVGTDKIYYILDDGPEKLYTGPVKTSTAGLQTIRVRAVDKLGNKVESEPIVYVVQ